jgi:hypothetical protein
LHWRLVKECLYFLGHHLLYEHKAPELVFEPIEALLRAIFQPLVRLNRQNRRTGRGRLI